MRGWHIALAATLAVAVVAATTSRSDARPSATTKVEAPATLGIAIQETAFRLPHAKLAWFDPLTLKAIPGRKAPLAAHVGSWAFSADRSRLAISSCWDETSDATGVRFVSARSMRVLGDLQLPQDTCLNGLTWLRPRRLLAVARTSNDAKLLVVDPVARRVLRRASIPAWPWAIAHSRSHLVLLYGGDDTFEPSRVLLVDANANGRSGT